MEVVPCRGNIKEEHLLMVTCAISWIKHWIVSLLHGIWITLKLECNTLHHSVVYVFLDAATLTEVFPCFFFSCKANARV